MKEVFHVNCDICELEWDHLAPCDTCKLNSKYTKYNVKFSCEAYYKRLERGVS